MPKVPYQRTFFINIDNINLDSIEGQNKLLLECQKALATQPLNVADRQAIKSLMDSMKVKKDIDTLRVVVETNERFIRLEKRLKEVEEERILQAQEESSSLKEH